MSFTDEEISRLYDMVMEEYDREGKFTKKEKETLLKFEPEFAKSILPLRKDNAAESVIPVFLVLFANRDESGLRFLDDRITGYNGKEKDILGRLLLYTESCLDGQEYRYLARIDKCINSLGKRLFKKIFCRLLETSLVNTNLVGGTHALPDFRIARTAVNILKEHGCDTIAVVESGAGVFAKASEGLVYTGIEPDGPLRLISDAICNAHRLETYKNVYGTFLSNWMSDKYDGVIGNLPVDADFSNEYRFFHMQHMFNDWQAEFIKKLLLSGTAGKAAVVSVHFDFANKEKYSLFREQLCKHGFLETVIALPEDIYINACIPNYLLVLDRKGGHKEVEFIDASSSLVRQQRRKYLMCGNDFDVRDCVKDAERIVVPHAGMAKVEWAFNPSIYLQNAVCPEGMELVRLGDLVTIPTGISVKGERFISSDFFSERFEKVVSGVTPSALGSKWEGISVEGPGLMIALKFETRREEPKLKCAICKDEGRYTTETYCPVLQPNPDRISLEYLALALMSDPTFAEYLKSIQAYCVDDFRPSHILERKIPILSELLEQKKAVLKALGRADMADTVYNVVLAGAGVSSERLSSLLSEFGCTVRYTADTVEGDDGLESILKKNSGSSVPIPKRIDAVVFNAGIPLDMTGVENTYVGLDAVLDLQLIYGKEGMLFFAFSDCDVDDVRRAGIISERRLRNLTDGHFFINDDGSKPSVSLVRALREELEFNTSMESKIRSQYKEAFVAAEWLDAAYPEYDIHSVEVLSDFLLAAARPGEDTTRKISDMRIVAHRIIEILRECRAVPTELDNGAVPHLLYEKKYEIKGKGIIYKQRVEIMPKQLSSSLISIVDIGNEGAHTFKSRPNLAMSMAQILMEFIQWFYKNSDTFSCKLSGYWTYGNENETRSDEIVGKVEVKIIGEAKKETIYYCEDIRLFVDRSVDIRAGDKVVIRERKEQTNQECLAAGIKWMAWPEGERHPKGYVLEHCGEEVKTDVNI